MASKADIEAGRAYVRLALNDSLTGKLKNVMGNARSTVSGFAAAIGPVATVAAGAITSAAAAIGAAVKQWADYGSALTDASGRTGVAASKLGVLQFAAGQAGATLADVEAAMRTMSRNGLDPRRFEEIGQAVAAIEDPGRRAAKAMELFGKNGTKLLPMLSQLNDLKAQSNALGPMLTDEEIAAADQLGDSLGALGEALNRAVLQIGAAIGPELQAALDAAIGAVVTVSRTIKAFRESNETGRGGDWLDVYAEMFRNGPPDFAAIGAQARQGFNANAGGGGLPDMGGGGRTSRQGSDATLSGWEEAMRDTNREYERRNALIRESETAEERFLRKQREILQAIKELNQYRVLGFLDEGRAKAQEQQLRIALRRVQIAEMERRAALAPKPEVVEKAAPEPARPVEMKSFAATQATSAFAALALQQGGSDSPVATRLDKLIAFHRSQEQKRRDYEAKHLTALERKNRMRA
jgi:hypothetical protein